MIDGSMLSVRPNSTIVIRDSASIFGGTNVRVTLDEGQMNVKTQDQTETSENIVEVKESENKLFPQTDASFKINEQNGGEIRISRGGVESNTGGEKVVIKENEFASINNGKILSKERLLDAPKPVAPQNSEQISSSSDVSFRWQKPDADSPLNFHLQVSKSPFFVPDAMLIERDSITNQIFTVANLLPEHTTGGYGQIPRRGREAIGENPGNLLLSSKGATKRLRQTIGRSKKSAAIFTLSAAKPDREQRCACRDAKFSLPATVLSNYRFPVRRERQASNSATKTEIERVTIYL